MNIQILSCCLNPPFMSRNPDHRRESIFCTPQSGTEHITHMIDLFDYILALFDTSYNANTLKRSFEIMLFMHGFEKFIEIT